MCGAQKAIVWAPYLSEKGQLGSGVACAWLLPCATARARGTLVPMPSHALLHGLTRLLAANGPWRPTPKSSSMGGERQGRTFILLWF